MSDRAITYLVVSCAVVFGLAAFVGLIVVPAVTAYGKAWERAAAAFLSLYVLAVLLAAGLLGGVEVIRLWDQLTG